jgi:hypothetical protein
MASSIQKTHYFYTLEEAQEFRERFENAFAGYHATATSPELVAPRSNEHFVAYTQHTGKYVVYTDRMSSCD